MALVDPLTRLSRHFILGDFLGNQSVYTKGIANGLDEDDPYLREKLRNGTVLAERILEPMLAEYGPISISYGFITPELSRRIVTYQDPDKPSHHRWDLGAAADVCVHRWVEGCGREDVTANSPAALAAMLVKSDGVDYPLSRLITYSESPFLCLAASAREVERYAPRMAVYENRYTGRPKVKPRFLSYGTPGARSRFVQELSADPDALAEHGWRGAGYPTHHGGGYQQLHHQRVSKYTMVSDWLHNLQMIANGTRNVPRLSDEATLDGFAAAGIVYDLLVDLTGRDHFSIIEGYAAPGVPSDNPLSDWRQDEISFTVVPPRDFDHHLLDSVAMAAGCDYEVEDYNAEVCAIRFTLEVGHVLEHAPI